MPTGVGPDGMAPPPLPPGIAAPAAAGPPAPPASECNDLDFTLENVDKVRGGVTGDVLLYDRVGELGHSSTCVNARDPRLNLCPLFVLGVGRPKLSTPATCLLRTLL